ncbi:zona pellucida sperm-binding protein 3 receptor-like isoform X3 [Varanus komodoensis]|uniref:zona pellucida sperm-binding protein 3 receptor-like isoform X3 n=1 Tax=Varanus komodoensis TaxID=61221 RepID=UPI001CF7B3A9|nr:zona pellucida sperm-binding protein 3 receptor-like isoform X3 [Varanus komodoensis]
MSLCHCCLGELLAWAFLSLMLLLSKVQGDCGRPVTPRYATPKNDLKDSYAAGSVVQYHCIPGYENIPGTTPSVRCLDPNWSAAPVFCRARKCRSPDLENGRITSPGDLALGSEITFTCDHGYRLVGQKNSRCIVTGVTVDWSGAIPYCQAILCYPPPKIAHGRHSGEDDGEYTYGSSVTYRCDAGFSLIGSASISCSVKANGVDGEWKPNAPECKDVKCKRPTIPNGMVASVFQAEYVYDNVIKIVCDAGYTLLGSEHIKCGADNSWKPAVPTCAKGIFTTTTTTTVTPGSKKNETIGPPIRPATRPTIRPTSDATEETGSAQSPDGAGPKDEPESSKTLGIALGIVVAGIAVVAAAILFAMKYKDFLKSGEPEPQPSFHASSHKDFPLEVK